MVRDFPVYYREASPVAMVPPGSEMTRRRLPFFKTYDIRGIVPDEITPLLAFRIARAMAVWSRAEEIIVGRDARFSSPAMAEAVIQGLIESGVRVIDAGMVTTPMLNFAVARLKRFGMMITASHNPKQYNGIKVIDPGVEQVYFTRGLDALELLVLRNRFPKVKQRGNVLLKSFLENYQDYLVGRFGGESLGTRSVVIDCSNGVGGLPLQVLERLGIHHNLLFHIPDGNFPNHSCDTLRPENLMALQKAVKRQKADLGLMFDGDSDRVSFIDDLGEIAPIDLVFVLLARQELELRKGQVFYDLRFSRIVKEEIEKSGGEAVMLRVGNPFHKEALHRNENGIIAAELSGHIMYKEHFGIDDPLYAFLKLLSCLSRTEGSLSRQLLPLRRYFQSGELRVKTSHPGAMLRKIKARFKDGDITELDGVTVQYPDWWFNLRPSNTEPVAKLVIEAESKVSLTLHKEELIKFLGTDSGAAGDTV